MWVVHWAPYFTYTFPVQHPFHVHFIFCPTIYSFTDCLRPLFHRNILSYGSFFTVCPTTMSYSLFMIYSTHLHILYLLSNYILLYTVSSASVSSQYSMLPLSLIPSTMPYSLTLPLHDPFYFQHPLPSHRQEQRT